MIEQRGRHVTCALIGTGRKLAAYEQPGSLNDAADGVCQRIQKVRVEPVPATKSEIATCRKNYHNCSAI